MNLWHAVVCGFVSTVVLTTIMSGGQGLGLTRMDIPFLLGTMLTPHRDRARWLGVGIHLVNGWLFAFIYVAIFQATGIEEWWFGAVLGALHASFVLSAGMALIPWIHPRMADEQHGPDPTRQLEPPGFLALNYGPQTPVATFVAHLVYGALLGWLYR